MALAALVPAPGRAGSALRLRRADAKNCPPQPAHRYEKVGLCARLSAFAEPWPRWACRPLRARAGAGADATAPAVPARGWVQRSAGPGPPPLPRTLGPTSSSRSSTGNGQGGRGRVRGARTPPRTRPRARAATAPICRADRARVRRPPPAFHPPLALSAPPLPTPRRPAHAQHAARVACPLVGRACSLVASSAAA